MNWDRGRSECTSSSDAALVLRRAFRRLAALRLETHVDRLVVRALRAAAPGPGAALLDAGIDAELDHDDALSRAATAFLAFSAFNLSDDLSDCECDYMPHGEAQAVVLIITSLFFSALRDLALAPELEARILADLVSSEEAQVLELNTTRWDAERLRVVTDGIAGGQWTAYLRLIWAGTPLERLAAEVAQGMGRVALLAGDIRCQDPRYTTLPPGDQRVMILEALHRADVLDVLGLHLTSSVLVTSQPILIQEFSRRGWSACSAPGPVLRASNAGDARRGEAGSWHR